MMRSNSSMGSIYSQDANLGGFDRSSADLSATTAYQKTISGATLGVKSKLNRSKHTKESSFSFGVKANSLQPYQTTP